MNEVILHGSLAAQFGARHRYHVQTPAEAMRALLVNKPGFADALRGMEVKIIRSRPGVEDGVELDEDLLGVGMNNGELHVVPYPLGSKNSGLGKIILGVALIGAVIITGGAAGAVMGGFWATAGNAIAGVSFLGISGGTMVLAGAAMALGGVAMMLAPTPKAEGGNQGVDTASFLFRAAINSSNQGDPVPLVYGLMLTGSVVISAGITDEQIALTGGDTYNGNIPYGSGFSLGSGTADNGWNLVNLV